jgi:hypothetical protein
MRNDELLSAIGDLALKTNASVGNASWYFFGSTHEGLPTASDIDLLVICETMRWLTPFVDLLTWISSLDRYIFPS